MSVKKFEKMIAVLFAIGAIASITFFPALTIYWMVTRDDGRIICDIENITAEHKYGYRIYTEYKFELSRCSRFEDMTSYIFSERGYQSDTEISNFINSFKEQRITLYLTDLFNIVLDDPNSISFQLIILALSIIISIVIYINIVEYINEKNKKLCKCFYCLK